jgi:multidrug efflux pump subunit AcrA (membrane-fusion protein)
MKQHIFTHKLITTTLPLALLTLCLAACNSGSDSEAAPTQPSDAGSVYQPAAGSIAANGTLLPARDVWLGFGVGGRLASVEAQVGQTVQAGQTLAALDATDLQRAAAQAELELQSAQARLAQLQAQAAPVPEQVSAATAAISSRRR